MKTVSQLIIVLLCLGCTEEQSRSVRPPPSADDGRSGPPAERFPRAESEAGTKVPAPGADVYTQSPEVQRLLYRARQLSAEGQFEQSLALVEQALQRDPYDPEAAALRQELLEILRRA